MSRVLFEVCVDSLAGVRTASAHGADRLELCSALELEGLTPSLGLLREARAATDLPIFAMLRPRSGDFCYDDPEFRTLLANLHVLLEEGVDGIVSGILMPDHSPDLTRMHELLQLTGGKPLTFHRAFDLCPDPLLALDQLHDLGIARVLTSGGAPTALEGASRIAACVQHIGTRLRILAGGGIEAATLPALLRQTSVREIHASASTRVDGRRITDATQVAALRAAL